MYQQSIFTIFSRSSVHSTVIRLIIGKNNHVIYPDPRCIVDSEVGEAAKVVGVAHGVVIAGDLISVKHCNRITIFLQEVCQWCGWHTICIVASSRFTIYQFFFFRTLTATTPNPAGILLLRTIIPISKPVAVTSKPRPRTGRVLINPRALRVKSTVPRLATGWRSDKRSCVQETPARLKVKISAMTAV
jgi:hypothetical protein